MNDQKIAGLFECRKFEAAFGVSKCISLVDGIVDFYGGAAD